MMSKLLVSLLLLMLSLAAAAPRSFTTNTSSSSKIANEGCRDRCGNVSIPYPFGMDKSHCYYNISFEIICDDSNNNSHPIPLLTHPFDFYDFSGSKIFGSSRNTSLEVLQVTQDYVRVNGWAPYICPNDTTNSAKENIILYSKLNEPFIFSSTQNKFIVRGCNIAANIISQPGAYTSGCVTYCDEKFKKYRSTSINSCDGNNNGCCEAPITDGSIQTLNISTSLVRNDTVDDCRYAFLVDKKVPLTDLFPSHQLIQAPVVLNWAIGGSRKDATCFQAQYLTFSYACGNNAYCNESNNSPGYHCYCSKGYQGNPYLLHGCEDIDECKESNECGNEAICINEYGSYYCSYEDPHHKTGINLSIVLPLGIGVGLVSILLLATIYWLYHRFQKKKQMMQKQNHFKRNGGLLLEQKISSNDGRVETTTKIFITEELEKTTDNFNKSRIIGKGGSGTVYKGMLSDGRIVAIKKSKLVDENQVDQFINEVVILSQTNHRHIVKLLGCCLETQVPLLVYEFVSNGTLSNHLYGEGSHASSISWKDRLRIAYEIGGALAYLHSDASIPIFHRDIKSSNILLDENYRAKISDFGISRSIPLDKTHLTTLVQGTFGYLDPEYFHSSQFTEKSDVYSFGVVLVELLTGEKAISLIRSVEEKSLALYFISSMKKNRLFEILDTRVINEGDMDEVLVVAKLAKRCLKLNGKKRPTMKEVSMILGGLRKFQEIQQFTTNDQQKFQEEEEEENCVRHDEIISSYYGSGTFHDSRTSE